MATSSELPAAGQIVHVRQRHYLVDERIDPVNAGDSNLLRLSCVDDDAQGQSLEVLWERELDGQILNSEAWDKIAERGFDPPRTFAAYLHTLRWNCVTSTDPNLLQSPFRAGIQLHPYQLEPLRKALRLPRVNLFIADDVGLGKTIEAGLIARELLMRKKVREIIVACPPSMLQQWREELEQRFGLQFEILDKDYVRRLRRERGFSVNPWTTHPRFLISHKLLIDENYAGGLREHLDGMRPGTLFILDEAHHAAPSSGRKYAIDSQITRAIRDLAPCFEHRLFLSATPHNGHTASFSSLLEILDSQRFCRGVKVYERNLKEVMVRRLKEDLRQESGGFPIRRIEQITIDDLPPDAPELQLASLLDEYRQLRELRLSGESKRTQASAGLLISGLQQRLFSSIEAFARTLNVHRKTVLRQWEASPGSSTRSDLLNSAPDVDDDRATLPDQDLAAEEDAQFAAITEATRGPTTHELFQREQQLLDTMTELANASRSLPDARAVELIRWIDRQMCPGLSAGNGQWNDVRVIIFTEYADTERYLRQQLATAIADTDRAAERIRVFHGPTPLDERETIKTAFNADPAQHPVRILIATDAAREGLNLQAHCWNLFHFDVPWNPSRMEQRNGRIDRKLQPNPEVFCHYFFYAQRPEDRVLAALVRKTKTIREELGSLAQVIDSRLDRLMKAGIQRPAVDALEEEIDTADLDPKQRETVAEELESTRERRQDLTEQIDKLRDMLDKSKRHLGLTNDQFRSAISCALELQGAPPLETIGSGERFVFPSLETNTWAGTMDSLRAPRPRDQKFYEWRRTAPIRPVVFDDPGVVTDEVVQLHLEHRVVQRLLSRFTAQGFAHFDLSRACLAQSSDPIPRVILVGRLALYGPGAARLHEELVPVTARWIDPLIRKAPLAPYAREAEVHTLRMLDEALISGQQRSVDSVQVEKLRMAAPNDVRELLPHLETRATEYARDARTKLAQRADSEAKAMREILQTQKKHIEQTASRYVQRELDFANNDEARQYESDRRHWERRLLQLDDELEKEPGRIRDVYQVRAKRIEPVGLIYLWPV